MLWEQNERLDYPNGAERLNLEELSLNEESQIASDKFKNIFNKGLWKVSRHPNLFFELVFWIGITIGGLNLIPYSLFGFFGPLILFLIMDYLTVPLTEKTMRETRPDFEEFCNQTNRYVPFIKL